MNIDEQTYNVRLMFVLSEERVFKMAPDPEFSLLSLLILSHGLSLLAVNVVSLEYWDFGLGKKILCYLCNVGVFM